MKKIIAIIITFSLSFALVACGTGSGDAAASAPIEESTEGSGADNSETTGLTTATNTETKTPSSTDDLNAGRDGAWEYYKAVKKNTDKLTRQESQVVVYSKSGSGDTAETQVVSLRINVNSALGSEEIGASGTVKAMGEVMPLNMHYSNGKLVSESNGNVSVEDSTYEAALRTVNVLVSFYDSFSEEMISNISVSDNADGTKLISMIFNGNIGETDSSGSGDLIINSEGLIISESFNISATDSESGLPITQSIESSLISYGDNTPEITPIAGNS